MALVSPRGQVLLEHVSRFELVEPMTRDDLTEAALGAVLELLASPPCAATFLIQVACSPRQPCAPRLFAEWPCT